MPPPWRITAERIKRLALPRGRRELGLFTAEGFRGVERALRNGSPLLEILVSTSFAESSAARNRHLLEAAASTGIPLQVAPDPILDELTQGRGLGDVFAVLPIPPPPEWQDLVSSPSRNLVLVGWNLADPGNTGAVIRSALAAGATGFIAVGTTDPWHPKAVRTSMGSLFALPVRHVDDDSWIDSLHHLGFESFATLCRDAEALPDIRLHSRHIALVLGSEAFGLDARIAARMDRRVTIPMPAGVDSFSINAAAALLAYSLLRAPSVSDSTS